MAEIRALFWDVGGVLLSNAWDHDERDSAIGRFRLDKAEFEARHKEAVPAFEEGRISLDQYLERTVFCQPRNFTSQDFKDFMFSLSRPKPEVLQFARSISDKCLMATINNESRELNAYRINKFGLAKIFKLFVSSCYLGVRKPEERIYQLALDLTQKDPQECCFIDDRPVNLEGAKKVGLQTILMKNVVQLKADLQSLGLET